MGLCASVFAPPTYAPGLNIALQLAILLGALMLHLRCQPYSNNDLNLLEMRALAVAIIGLILAGAAIFPSWSKPHGGFILFTSVWFLIFIAMGLYMCVSVVRAFLADRHTWLWSLRRFGRRDEHVTFSRSICASSCSGD